MRTRNAIAAALAAAVLACSSPQSSGFPTDTNGDGGVDASSSLDSGQGDEVGSLGGGNGGPSFGSTCKGASTTLTGTVYAPNGTDPLPNVLVYAASKVNPFPASNYCSRCDSPIDVAYAHTNAKTDGTFSLDLGTVPAGADITFGINVGRFRKITKLPVNACGATTAPRSATTLPGKSADGDIPKIAVSTGSSDHLDQILSALGITEYDCYEGRAQTGTTSPTCQPIDSLSNLLLKQSAKTIDAYHLLFVSCAPNAFKGYAGKGVNTTTLSTNVNAFVTTGGRLFATDMSYDYIAQAFPADVTWMGPTGAPQPIDGANVGVAGSYAGNIDDPSLKAWLAALGVQANPTVPITGFLNPWSVQASLPMSSTLIVDGTVSYTANGATQSADVPLTTEFDVAHCGRVVYSSYHTASGTVNPQSLAPQERILEYLMFNVATCVNPPPR